VNIDNIYGRQVRLLVRLLPIIDAPVIRGSVFPAVRMEVRKIVEQHFGYAEIQLASLPDLYAGKLCAALDRQHPRDLFDVKLLLENEGLTEELKKTFLVFLISHHRPIHELLAPNLKDLRQPFDTEFAAMTQVEILIGDLEGVRKQLIDLIHQALTPDEKEFLLSFKRMHPKWELLGIKNADHIPQLPSVRWKMINLERLENSKHSVLYKKLESVLSRPS